MIGAFEAFAEDLFAGGPLVARQRAGAVQTIKIIADQDRTTVVVAHLLCEINLSRRHVFAICLDLNQATAGSVVRRDEDSVSARHRGRNVRGIVGRARILPQQAPVAQIKPHRPARGEENDLLDAARLDRDGR